MLMIKILIFVLCYSIIEYSVFDNIEVKFEGIIDKTSFGKFVSQYFRLVIFNYIKAAFKAFLTLNNTFEDKQGRP